MKFDISTYNIFTFDLLNLKLLFINISVLVYAFLHEWNYNELLLTFFVESILFLIFSSIKVLIVSQYPLKQRFGVVFGTGSITLMFLLSMFSTLSDSITEMNPLVFVYSNPLLFLMLVIGQISIIISFKSITTMNYYVYPNILRTIFIFIAFGFGYFMQLFATPIIVLTFIALVKTFIEDRVLHELQK
jgi:hypothetical protein